MGSGESEFDGDHRGYICDGCHHHIINNSIYCHGPGCLLRGVLPRSMKLWRERRSGTMMYLSGMRTTCPRCGELLKDNAPQHDICPVREKWPRVIER